MPVTTAETMPPLRALPWMDVALSSPGAFVRISFVVLACLLAALTWSTPARAARGYDDCTGFVTAVPAVISKPGTWCLKKNLNTAIASGNAIEIQGNNITIDCNDFALSGLPAGTATQAFGIYALRRSYATVRNCTVRGFRTGVLLADAAGAGHVVEDNRLDRNTVAGIDVAGSHAIVRRNRVSSTGGSPIVATTPFAITTDGVVDVVDNIVAGVAPSAGAVNQDVVGIGGADNTGARIMGNDVGGLAKAGSGSARGIVNATAGLLTLRRNNVVGDGSAGSVGLACADASGRASENIVSGFATALSVCNDSGRNDVVP